MLTCIECGEPLEPGRWHIERAEDPEEEDATPELAWFCRRCAEREGFVRRRAGGRS